MSVISSVYDPFGFLCPVILQAKAIFQEKYRLKKGWGEPLEPANAEKWSLWKHRLTDVEQYK